MQRLLLCFLVIGLSTSCSVQRKASNDASSRNGGTGDGQGQDLNSYAIDSPLGQKLVKLIADIKARRPELERARDQRGKLQTALLEPTKRGCLANVVITSIELKVTSAQINPTDVSDETQAYTMDVNNKFSIEFSNGSATSPKTLNCPTHDESQEALFATGRSHICSFSDNKTFKIGDLNKMKITKMATSFTTDDLCGSTPNCPYKKRVKEINRYQLDAISIKINSSLEVYQKGSLNFVFSRYPTVDQVSRAVDSTKTYGLEFIDDKLQMTIPFVNALNQTTDCSLYQ